MLDLLRDKNEAKHCGGEGNTLVTTACPESWKVKVMDLNIIYILMMLSHYQYS